MGEGLFGALFSFDNTGRKVIINVFFCLFKVYLFAMPAPRSLPPPRTHPVSVKASATNRPMVLIQVFTKEPRRPACASRRIPEPLADRVSSRARARHASRSGPMVAQRSARRQTGAPRGRRFLGMGFQASLAPMPVTLVLHT